MRSTLIRRSGRKPNVLPGTKADAALRCRSILDLEAVEESFDLVLACELNLVYSDFADVHLVVMLELLPETSKNGHTQFLLEDSRALRRLP